MSRYINAENLHFKLVFQSVRVRSVIKRIDYSKWMHIIIDTQTFMCSTKTGTDGGGNFTVMYSCTRIGCFLLLFKEKII